MQGAGLGLEYRAAETGLVVAHALVHQIQQELLGEDVDFQGAVAARPVAQGEERLLDPAGFVEAEEGDVALRIHAAGAYGGNVRTGGQMGLVHILERDIDDEVTVRQDHMGLPDAL